MTAVTIGPLIACYLTGPLSALKQCRPCPGLKLLADLQKASTGFHRMASTYPLDGQCMCDGRGFCKHSLAMERRRRLSCRCTCINQTEFCLIKPAAEWVRHAWNVLTVLEHKLPKREALAVAAPSKLCRGFAQQTHL